MMSNRPPVQAYRTVVADGVRTDQLQRGMQGQEFVVIVDGRPGGNAEDSPLCQLGILMKPGKVSTPHVHYDVNVYVRLEECGHQGVLTLYGDALEHEEWLFEGQTLWIPPGVPHVAVYPRFHGAPTAVAIETRTTPDPLADVVTLTALWPTLRDRLDGLGLLEHVEAPLAANW
jgi:uncharacterized RmlC-like cupin family protein